MKQTFFSSLYVFLFFLILSQNIIIFPLQQIFCIFLIHFLFIYFFFFWVVTIVKKGNFLMNLTFSFHFFLFFFHIILGLVKSEEKKWHIERFSTVFFILFLCFLLFSLFRRTWKKGWMKRKEKKRFHFFANLNKINRKIENRPQFFSHWRVFFSLWTCVG